VVEPRVELHSLVICDHAITANDGKISAIGIFGQITVNRLPSVHGRFFIVAVMEADPGSHALTLQVISPSGQAMLPDPPTMRLEVPPNTTTANIVADMQGLQVRELGRHRIELRAGDRLLGTTPFNVNLAWTQQQAGNA
jgi:hypothetical protein